MKDLLRYLELQNHKCNTDKDEKHNHKAVPDCEHGGQLKNPHKQNKDDAGSEDSLFEQEDQDESFIQINDLTQN